MALRNEFGEVERWKVVLILELIVLLVVGSLIINNSLSSLFGQESKASVSTNPSPLIKEPANEVPMLGKVIKSTEACDGMFCALVQEKNTSIVYLVEYNGGLGEVFVEETVYLIGEIKAGKELKTFIASSIERRGIEVPLESVQL